MQTLSQYLVQRLLDQVNRGGSHDWLSRERGKDREMDIRVCEDLSGLIIYNVPNLRLAVEVAGMVGRINLDVQMLGLGIEVGLAEKSSSF